MSACFPIRCKGRDEERKEVLDKPVDVKVNISKIADRYISFDVDCPYNTGAHGQRCKASHPGVDKIGEGITCAYSLDLPYAIDLYESLRHQGKAFPKEAGGLEKKV